MLTGTKIWYVEWLNTMFERPSFNSRGLTMQLRVLHTVTNRAAHPASCHSFIFPSHPPCCRLNTCVDRTERFVTHLVTCARGHESWRAAEPTNTHMQAQTHTHAGTDTRTQTHGCSVIIHSRTGIQLHKHSRLCVDAVWICDVTTTWIHRSTTRWFR